MKQQVHFIGIGGIGVSALARYYLAKDWQVSGSDLTASEITDDLQTEGAKVYIGHGASYVNPRAKLVIYSVAVQENNPELKEAKALQIPVASYAEALGDLTKQYITIAVSGAHGKSTTTAFLALMLIKAGLDPTVIIGTRLREFKGKNFRLGKSRYLIIEADEWNRSFWRYHPAVAVITNIDKEHLDTYKDLTGVIKAFNHYLKNIPAGATAIINASDKNSVLASKGCKCKIVTYYKGGKLTEHWPLKIPGHFNQLNAEAAWQAAKIFGIKKSVARKAVMEYKGSWRRMEPLGLPSLVTAREQVSGTFYSDYAHHPNEIQATIGAFKEKYPSRKLLVVFQPHQAERLTNLFDDFVTCFDQTDELALLPTYEVAGRELGGDVKKIEDLYVAVKERLKPRSVFYLKNFNEAFKLIRGQVVVFMGAGDIDKSVRKYFVSKLLT